MVKMMKESIIIMHMWAPKNVISKYIKEQLKELQREISNYTQRMSYIYFRN